ncbi:MAG: serine protein kinase RIO [Nocardioidaceae bacterium]
MCPGNLFEPDPSAAELADPDPAGALAFTYAELAELGDDQRWSTWSSVERGAHGPNPRPSWVITDDAAVDTELGLLKTGKEADVFLLERAVPGAPGRMSVLAAKRYRTEQHRSFHRSAAYTEGRRTRNTRDARAMAKKTSFGRSVAAGQWAFTEFAALARLWQVGVPVPYPVQVDGTELLLEFIEFDGAAAPRLAQLRPEASVVRGYWEQLREAMTVMVRGGLVHGDLSPYNLLAQGDRLVLIDLPQVVDLVGNPRGMEFLERDCRNVCSWFSSRGLDADAGQLFGELVAAAF